MVLSEIRDLVDYDDFEKDDQRWTDGSGVDIPLTNELGNTGKSLDELIPTTNETND